MHIKTLVYLRILLGGLFPSRLVEDHEDVAGMRIIQRKNWTHLGIAFLIALVLTAILWILTGAYLAGPEHMFLTFNVGNVVFAAGTITVSYLALDWVVKNTLIPASLMMKIWPKDTERELRGCDDYLIASEELSRRFWRTVAQNGLTAAMEKAHRSRPKKAVYEDPKEGGMSSPLRSYGAETPAVTAVPDQSRTMLNLAYITVACMFVMITLAIVSLVKDLTVSLIWIGALLLIAGVVAGILKMNSKKSSTKSKGASKSVFAAIVVAILCIAGALSLQPVRNLLFTGTGIGNTGGLMASLGGNLVKGDFPTSFLPEPSSTATPSQTPTPEPVPQVMRIVVGEYSLEVKEKTNTDMAQDLSTIAQSVNSVRSAYKQAADIIKAEDGNMANWGTLCYGSEAQQMSIAEVSIQNRSFLNVGFTLDGQPVMSYFDRLAALKETGAITEENATQLYDLARLLNGILEEHEALCVPLSQMESLGKAANGDYSLVDQGVIAELFAQAKEIAAHINEVAKTYNELKQEPMERLERLEGPDGQDLIEFLEQVYPADEQDVYITATPGPTFPSIISTLLPPTATPTPQNACWASTQIDEGKTYIGYEWGIEDYIDELGVSGSMTVERYIEACTGFVFYFNKDITGDGRLDWGIMQEIGVRPALNQYTQMGHDQANFVLVLADDPLWPDGAKDYIYRQDNGAVIFRDWPIPPEIQPTATAHATQVSGCRPADTSNYGDWNKIPLRWQELASGLGADGKAKYHTCASDLHYVTVEMPFAKYWFNQNDAPPNIAQDTYFWVDWNGNPYYWVANPTPTATPPSVEMCRPGRTDVFGTFNKLNITWQQLDNQFASDGWEDFAWYYRCRADAVYVVVMVSLPGDVFNLYWLNQNSGPTNISEGQAFWVNGDSAYLSSSQFEPPAR